MKPQTVEAIAQKLRDNARHQFRMARLFFSIGDMDRANKYEDTGRQRLADAHTAEKYAARRG